MKLEEYTQALESSAAAVRALVSGVTPQQAHWKPDEASWSLLEVISHLADEEREDFRAHLQGALQQPALPWSEIDPQRWVMERHYNERDLEPTLAQFLAERAASLAWLRSLAALDANAGYDLPWGRLNAGDLLAAWAAHDLLHLRQLVELRYAWLAQNSLPFDLGYAGGW